jgi:hypothetical protein
MNWILGTLLVLAGCSDLERSRSFALDVDADAAATLKVGDSCDPIAWDTCGAGLVCVVSSCDGDGGCVARCVASCGNADVYCDPPTVCTLSHDCIPPCTIGGAPVYETTQTGTCESNGLMSTDDGRCVVPCFNKPLCEKLGGASCANSGARNNLRRPVHAHPVGVRRHSKSIRLRLGGGSSEQASRPVTSKERQKVMVCV